MDTKEKLDILADLQAEADALRLKKEEILQTVLTPEIKQSIADIDAEFLPRFEGIHNGIAKYTAEIEAEILAAGESVKGAYLHAVYTRGRTTWDTKMIEAYSQDHPEVLRARKEGKPSVSIRKVS
jgi:hypothetical protein